MARQDAEVALDALSGGQPPDGALRGLIAELPGAAVVGVTLGPEGALEGLDLPSRWLPGAATQAARRDALLEALRFEVADRYADAAARAADYSHIVSDAQFQRLSGLLDDAREPAYIKTVRSEGYVFSLPVQLIEPKL